ncbi:lysozyme inhibitor LprI family protein [uncultured Shewanella sp.]|uniref:lysozyme inhibitor LprI family protein n=1 Tax=uncultured Shewanella sp. TaxID=173975 RepID=UPI00261F74D4|nr:lysozyme inhibitor LprI family protein [uncultured Shewanella sp.]
MNYFKICYLFLFLSLISFFGKASITETSVVQTTLDINNMSLVSYEEADKDLNALYQKIMVELNDQYELKKALKISERAWIKFKELDCLESESSIWADGTGSTSAVYQCFTDKTITRINTLVDRFSPFIGRMEAEPYRKKYGNKN